MAEVRHDEPRQGSPHEGARFMFRLSFRLVVRWYPFKTADRFLRAPRQETRKIVE